MTFEMLPNWHPFFVHFTIAFFSVGPVLYLGAAFVPLGPGTQARLLLLARFCLWLGALLALVTVLTGLYAFSTVAHNKSAHLAMVNHRNWALATALAGFVIAALTFWQRDENHASKIMAGLTAVLFVLVMITGFKGAELVYRHGIGVESNVTDKTKTHHQHDHNHDHDH